MQAHILYLHTPSTPGMRSQVKTIFSKVVIWHIKLEGSGAYNIEHHAIIYSVLTHTRPLGSSQKVKYVLKRVCLPKVVMLYFISKSSLLGKGQIFFSKRCHVADQIKGNRAYSTIHANDIPYTHLRPMGSR